MKYDSIGRPARGYGTGVNSVNYVNKIHFQYNARRVCPVMASCPSFYTTEAEKVTCSRCKQWINNHPKESKSGNT